MTNLPKPLQQVHAQREAQMRSDPNAPRVGKIASITDDELIATLVAGGQAKWAAEEIRGNPMLRFCALRYWCDVQDAGEGDKEAKMRVDYMREQWLRMRKEELLSDDPKRMHTELVDPRVLL